MRHWSKTKKIIVGLLLFFLFVQVFQPKRNQGITTGPASIIQVMQVPQNIQSILETSCYDCHSNATKYPWYSHITPVNWWLANHVNEGKDELNFSLFGHYDEKKKAKKFDEILETVEEGEMPLKSYLLVHKNADLTNEQRNQLLSWAKTELSKLPPIKH